MQITQLNNSNDFPKFILHLSNKEMITVISSLYKISHNEFADDELNMAAHRLWKECLENARPNIQSGLS